MSISMSRVCHLEAKRFAQPLGSQIAEEELEPQDVAAQFTAGCAT